MALSVVRLMMTVSYLLSTLLMIDAARLPSTLTAVGTLHHNTSTSRHIGSNLVAADLSTYSGLSVCLSVSTLLHNSFIFIDIVADAA